MKEDCPEVESSLDVPTSRIGKTEQCPRSKYENKASAASSRGTGHRERNKIQYTIRTEKKKREWERERKEKERKKEKTFEVIRVMEENELRGRPQAKKETGNCSFTPFETGNISTNNFWILMH